MAAPAPAFTSTFDQRGWDEGSGTYDFPFGVSLSHSHPTGCNFITRLQLEAREAGRYDLGLGSQAPP